MRRRVTTILLFTAVAGLGAQQPTIQNGRVETRTVTSIGREVSAVGASASPVWVAWSVPMVAGDRSLCSTWSDGYTVVRGETLEPRNDSRPPQFPAPTGPARLEAGTSLVVFARLLNGQVERIRTIGDDCQVDAGGTTIHWLTGVTPGESLQYLDSLTRAESLNVGAARRVAESAVTAIALHREAGADAILDRLTGPSAADALRRQAASGLGAHRGAHGFDRLMGLIRDERNRDLRRHFVSALSQNADGRAMDALLGIARADADASVRAEAASRYIRRAGAASLTTALTLLDQDADESVKRRIVSSIGALPEPAATPALIQLAKAHPNVTVRKNAVAALARSNDPQAKALLEDLLR